MDSERDKAKRSIKQRDREEPELTDAIAQAQKLRLTMEENRHREAMKSADLGWFGRVLGAESSASVTVAFIVVCAGLITAALCLVWAAKQPAASEFWGKQAERSAAIAMTSLSYIFGRSPRKP